MELGSGIERSTLRVNGERLWARLMQLARIGATPRGGCRRLALSDEDKAGRDLFVEWCRRAGCDIEVDAIGNIFARRAGRRRGPAVLVGSHLDTQPTGGRFDGVYGVLAGLELVETLRDAGLETDLPIELAVWTNEEGARFTPALLGSSVFAGALALERALEIADASGASVGDELERIGYRGEAMPGGRDIAAAFELHIEQGPILEARGCQIGVVSGIQGLRWYDVILTGQACHAGPTPMAERRDPVRGAAAIIEACFALAEQHAPWGRATVGAIRVQPASRNTVPESATLWLDVRHPEAETLDAMDRSLRALVAAECGRRRLEGRVEEHWHMPATRFAPRCVELVAEAAAALGYSHMEMVSGAGHDSLNLARVAPTGMIFVPCAGGLSHNEQEYAAPADVEAGCNVLLHAVLGAASS